MKLCGCVTFCGFVAAPLIGGWAVCVCDLDEVIRGVKVTDGVGVGGEKVILDIRARANKGHCRAYTYVSTCI